MIYTQHYFRRRMRKIPSPSCLPIAIMFAIISMCIIVVIPPVITGVKVDLPKLNTQPIEIFDDFKYITVFINDDGGIIINNTVIQTNQVGDAIKSVYNNTSIEDIKIFVRAGNNVSYDKIIELLQVLNDYGFLDITLVGKYTGGIQDIKK